MAELRHVGRIFVSLWGHRVGIIIPAPRQGFYAFKYDQSFLTSGIEIAPLMMPLRPEPYQFIELPLSEYYGLPPVFADSLPDAFGNTMIDRWMAQHGYEKNEVSPLDRLAYIGRRGIGALTYEPERGTGGRPTVLDMRQLVEEARRVVNGELAGRDEPDALREIIRIGSSAGGAQAKAVVGWNRATGSFMLGDRELPDGFEHWIVKFTPQAYPWRGEREYNCYLKAKAAGLMVPEAVLYELDNVRHFMVKRFDRAGCVRHHVQTLSAIAHFPMSVPLESRTYEQFMATVDELNLGYDALEEAFRRTAFNIYVDECDDHTKNFSFLLKEGGRWSLAPAYDLTGSSFPSDDPWSAHGRRHQLSLNGKFADVTDDDLLAFADRFAIGTAPKILSQIKDVCGTHHRSRN